MPVQADTNSTHSVVRWQDNTNQYAVVDLKRAKTAITTLKIGITTLFEGYDRERRRGEIVFIGSKKDCFTYGFDSVENENQLDVYCWSGPPGLREQAHEVAQAIRGGSSSTFQRTISSSSTTSSITTAPKQKQKKNNNTNQNDIDEITTFDDNSMPPPPSTSTLPVTEPINTINKDVDENHPSNSNKKGSSSNTSTNVVTQSNDNNSLLEDIQSLREENKSLREKHLNLEDELVFLRKTSIPLPNEETYNFLKSITMLYEKTKDEYTKKTTELGKQLPCSAIELELAGREANVARAINRVVKSCFKDIKDVDIRTMAYKEIYAKHPQLLDQIYEYIKCIHAPLSISKSRYGAIISQKTRHLRDEDKRKGVLTTSKDKQKPKKKQNNSNKKLQCGTQQSRQASNEIFVEDMDYDKENTDENE